MAKAPLDGLRVIEMGSLIAGPFCGQILGDFGAEVIKLEDPKVGDPMRQWGRSKPQGLSPWWPVIGRNKKSVTVDLRTGEGRDLARSLIAKADVVVENFRPGTMEAWGMGYEALSADHPGLVMARVSGFGQTGPYSHRAGYALVGEAMGGLRHITGEPDRNPARAGISIGDSLSGLNAALGVMMALHARDRTGKGQVVDAAMVDGSSVLIQMMWAFRASGMWSDVRGTNMLDTGAPYYDTYETADGRYVAAGAIEPQFYAAMLAGLELDPAELPGQNDIARWPELKAIFTKTFLEHDRDHWAKVFAGTDACVTPVLAFGEVLDEPHIAERDTFYDAGTDGLQPAPAPRFSRSVPENPTPPRTPGADTEAVLRDWT